MRYSISDTAEYGDYMSGERVVGKPSREAMKEVLKEIQDGTFARKWIRENEEGRPEFNRIAEAEKTHLIEQVGGKLRKTFSWLDQKETVKP